MDLPVLTPLIIIIEFNCSSSSNNNRIKGEILLYVPGVSSNSVGQRHLFIKCKFPFTFLILLGGDIV